MFADGSLYIFGIKTDMVWNTVYGFFYNFSNNGSNGFFVILGMFIVALIVLTTVILTFIGNSSIKKKTSDNLAIKIQFIIYLVLFIYNFFTINTPYGTELCGYINFSNYNLFGYLIILFFIVTYVTVFAISKKNNERNQ